MTRRDLMSLFLSLPFVSWAKKMEDIDVLGCKIKRDRLYRVNEDRIIFQWVKQESKGVYSVGFMQVLSSMLYPLYSVKIKPVGTVVEFDSNLAVVETGKRVSTFPSPMGGRIVQVNKDVEKDPSRIINSPYSAWLVMIESEDEESIRGLKRAEDVVEAVRGVIIREKVDCLPKR